MLLLEEFVDNGIRECYFDSSNVHYCRYDNNTSSLEVVFKNGDTYLYSDVPAYSFARLKIAESQGKAINKFIKPHYEATKIGKHASLEMIISKIKNILDEKNN